MAAADVVLMASGTAALEGMLLKKPMVVSYKLSKLTAYIVRKLLTQPFVSLPNLLAGKALVPELLQEDANVESLSAALNRFIEDGDAASHMKDEFLRLHKMLRLDADNAAANAVVQLIAP